MKQHQKTVETLLLLIIVVGIIWRAPHLLSSLLKISVYKEEPLPNREITMPPTKLSFTITYPGKVWWSWDQIPTSNSFAVNGKQGFGFCEIKEDLSMIYTPLKDGFPGEPTSFKATPDGKILWGKAGYRGLLAIDKESLETINIMSVTDDGSSEISDGWSISYEHPHLLVNVSYAEFDDTKTAQSWICYNLNSEEEVFRNKDFGDLRNANAQDYSSLISTGNKGEFLGEHFDVTTNKDVGVSDWHVVTITDNGFSKPLRNKLTEEMTKTDFGLTVSHQEIKRWDINKRYIFGTTVLPKDTPRPDGIRRLGIVPTVVRWDEDMENIVIAPLIAHIPKDHWIKGSWAVSPNGEWARCGVISRDRNNKTFYSCFFHLDEKYPLGVSAPVIGTASQGLDGIFVEHDILGTLYLDRSDDFEGGVLIYKMSDMAESLVAIAKEKAGL